MEILSFLCFILSIKHHAWQKLFHKFLFKNRIDKYMDLLGICRENYLKNRPHVVFKVVTCHLDTEGHTRCFFKKINSIAAEIIKISENFNSNVKIFYKWKTKGGL